MQGNLTCVTITVITTITKAFKNPLKKSIPHPRIIERGTYIHKPGCTWESLGGTFKNTDIGFHWLWCDVSKEYFNVPWWFWCPAGLENGSFTHSISSLREAPLQTHRASLVREESGLLHHGAWFSEAEFELICFFAYSCRASHLDTGFLQSLMETQAPSRPILILLKLTQYLSLLFLIVPSELWYMISFKPFILNGIFPSSCPCPSGDLARSLAALVSGDFFFLKSHMLRALQAEHTK